MHLLRFFARCRARLEYLALGGAMSGFFLFSTISTIVQLLFPMFLNVTLYADVREKKMYFSLYILRVFKVYGGYATLYNGGIAFHLTDKKAVLLPFREMTDERNKFELKLFRGFYLYAFSGIAEIGAQSQPAAAIMAAALLQSVAGIAAGTFAKRKRCASFKNDVIVYADRNGVKASARVVLVFNFLAVLLAASKIILQTIVGKIDEYKRNRTKQKS